MTKKKPYLKPVVRSTAVPKGSTLRVWSAEWCAPCKAMKKAGTWEKIAEHFEARLEYKSCDTPEQEAEADEFKIQAFPTTQLVGPKGEVLASFEGSGAYAQCVKALETELAS